jgi:ribosomal protein S27AE
MTIEEAIKWLNIELKEWENDCLSNHPVKEALRVAIEALEQEPRKGHWIYDKNIANWICSKCGETPKTIGYVGTGAFMAEHFKYCNHCGAEMEGSEEV